MKKKEMKELGWLLLNLILNQSADRVAWGKKTVTVWYHGEVVPLYQLGQEHMARR